MRTRFGGGEHRGTCGGSKERQGSFLPDEGYGKHSIIHPSIPPHYAYTTDTRTEGVGEREERGVPNAKERILFLLCLFEAEPRTKSLLILFAPKAYTVKQVVLWLLCTVFVLYSTVQSGTVRIRLRLTPSLPDTGYRLLFCTHCTLWEYYGILRWYSNSCVLCLPPKGEVVVGVVGGVLRSFPSRVGCAAPRQRRVT